MKTGLETGIRHAIIRTIFLAWVVAIGVRLVDLQVYQGEALLARAERQQRATIDLSPKRGVIFDRNGNELARSVWVKSLYAAPSRIQDAARAADDLSRLLQVDREALHRRLTSNAILVAVKRKLSDEEVARVEKLGLEGLEFVGEMKRFYVGGRSASHVLGFVDIDERGMAGIEMQHDGMIRGQGGRLELQLDARKHAYSHRLTDSIPGADVTLTIDVLLQHHVEQALEEAVRKSRAKGGTAVVIQPATGAILALANYPAFDPNALATTTAEQRQNAAIEVAFEPGSIFKLVTYSAALEEGLIKPTSLVDAGGPLRIGSRVIKGGRGGALTAAQALAKSSNPAAVRLAQQLGAERLARYTALFGFGQRTGIELPAESRGLLREVDQWDTTSIASIPMGHEVGVTAVQAAAAFAAIANGGELVKPHIISRITSSSGDVLEEHRRESRRVVSERTAAWLKDMLEGVVLHGTGKKASVTGYRAAGKTGTAQKFEEALGRYSKTRYVASFAGFAPTEHPEIACIVSIDEPRGAYYGGDVAAPVFARIVADALALQGVSPELDPGSSLVAGAYRVFEVPPTLVPEATPVAHSSDRDAGVDQPVVDAAEGTAASEFEGPPAIIVPDMKGRGIREALALCAERGLRLEANGAGVIQTQFPAAGSRVPPQTVCQVQLSRPISDASRNAEAREMRRTSGPMAAPIRKNR